MSSYRLAVAAAVGQSLPHGDRRGGGAHRRQLAPQPLGARRRQVGVARDARGDVPVRVCRPAQARPGRGAVVGVAAGLVDIGPMADQGQQVVRPCSLPSRTSRLPPCSSATSMHPPPPPIRRRRTPQGHRPCSRRTRAVEAGRPRAPRASAAVTYIGHRYPELPLAAVRGIAPRPPQNDGVHWSEIINPPCPIT